MQNITSPPLVSVIIPTYQRECDMVDRAVRSVKAQTYPHIELFVVDDNVDGSPLCEQLAAYFGHMDGVTYLRQDGNKGACAARNLGIAHAKGEYIGFLDDDDAWLPEKIEKQLARFAPGVGLVYTQGYTVKITEDGSETRELYYNANGFRLHTSFEELLCRDSIGTTTQALVKKECFDTVGGFREDLPARQDYEMWLRISRNYGMVGVPEPLFLYYCHQEDQITKDPAKALAGMQVVFRLYKKECKKSRRAAEHIVYPLSVNAKKCRRPLLYLYYRLFLIYSRRFLQP